MTHDTTRSNIEFNRNAHNKVAAKYASIHGEIYNQHEQDRLHASLKEALALIQSVDTDKKQVLDLGCGAGNLTDHLVALGAIVTASDISENFLEEIESRYQATTVMTLQLNGSDLSNVMDESFDMVASYSVLHHIPDYLGIIDECMRVLKPGGILYLDHDVPDEYWSNIAKLKIFYSKAQSFGFHLLMKFLLPENYVDFFIRKLYNPRFRREGDIHVFPDDHIEWKKISERVQRTGDLLYLRDYLLYRTGFKEVVYETHRCHLADMRLGVYRKRNLSNGA